MCGFTPGGFVVSFLIFFVGRQDGDRPDVFRWAFGRQAERLMVWLVVKNNWNGKSGIGWFGDRRLPIERIGVRVFAGGQCDGPVGICPMGGLFR